MSQTTATDKPISPLRRRMIEDMTVRGFGEKTQYDYIRHVKNFTIFLGRAPDTATPEDLRGFQLHQRQTDVQTPTMNGAVSALRFFFTTTCDQPELARHLRIVKQPQKLPVVLTTEEVARLLEAAPGPKYRTALAVAYGAGLRVSEVASLKVSDKPNPDLHVAAHGISGGLHVTVLGSIRYYIPGRGWFCHSIRELIVESSPIGKIIPLPHVCSLPDAE